MTGSDILKKHDINMCQRVIFTFTMVYVYLEIYISCFLWIQIIFGCVWTRLMEHNGEKSRGRVEALSEHIFPECFFSPELVER